MLLKIPPLNVGALVELLGITTLLEVAKAPVDAALMETASAPPTANAPVACRMTDDDAMAATIPPAAAAPLELTVAAAVPEATAEAAFWAVPTTKLCTAASFPLAKITPAATSPASLARSSSPTLLPNRLEKQLASQLQRKTRPQAVQRDTRQNIRSSFSFLPAISMRLETSLISLDDSSSPKPSSWSSCSSWNLTFRSRPVLA